MTKGSILLPFIYIYIGVFTDDTGGGMPPLVYALMPLLLRPSYLAGQLGSTCITTTTTTIVICNVHHHDTPRLSEKKKHTTSPPIHLHSPSPYRPHAVPILYLHSPCYLHTHTTSWTYPLCNLLIMAHSLTIPVIIATEYIPINPIYRYVSILSYLIDYIICIV